MAPARRKGEATRPVRHALQRPRLSQNCRPKPRLTPARSFRDECLHENLAYYARHGYTETHRAEQDGFRRVFLRKPIDGPPDSPAEADIHPEGGGEWLSRPVSRSSCRVRSDGRRQAEALPPCLPASWRMPSYPFGALWLHHMRIIGSLRSHPTQYGRLLKQGDFTYTMTGLRSAV